MQIVRPASFATRRSRWITRACSSCVPWEKLSRATSMPSRIRSRSAASDELAGPSVQTIFALRKCTVDFAFEPPGWVIQYLYLFLGESVVGSLGVGLGVYFSAQQNDRGNNVHPHQERDSRTERAVHHVVSRVMRHIPPKEHSGGKP